MSLQVQEVTSETPTDVQHPVMYERAVYLLGAIGGLAVLGLIALAWRGQAINDGLVAIGASAVAGLVGLLTPRR